MTTFAEPLEIDNTTAITYILFMQMVVPKINIIIHIIAHF